MSLAPGWRWDGAALAMFFPRHAGTKLVRRRRFARCGRSVSGVATIALLLLAVGRVSGQEALDPSIVGEGPTDDVYRSPSELKKLSLEQLVDVEITSASRRPEPISQASSAIDVITGDTIRRSGALNLPDALRLGAGMEVAQIDGHTWAISARGFNISTANKLQVLLDGRSLYTPLFSGVFWDVQRTFLPDLEQIEVIRGPGATLWGANAVNGVINIRTKSARDTQGFLVDAVGGSEGGSLGLRYGGRMGRDTYYRAYVMRERADGLSLEGGGDAQDETDFTQGGFRVDSVLGLNDTLTVQGDGYAGAFGQLNAQDVEVDGGNFLARWGHQFGVDSSLSVQGYYDRTHRLIPGVFEEYRNTFDVELEGRFVLGAHDIVYGGNYRVSLDEIGNLGPTIAFLPANETEHLISAYVQDEWHIIPRQFSAVAGSKFEYNTFSGFEIQPSGRLVWTPAADQTFWGAVSRAVRTPTRIDQDVFAPNPATGAPVVLRGTRDFESEVLFAYELGYRVQPSKTLSLDLSLYYNDYDNLRSQEPQGPAGTPFVLANMLEGHTYGATLAGRWRVTDWWELDGNVSALHVDLHRSPGSLDPSNGVGEANDPDYFFALRSSMDLPGHIQFNAVLRYVSDLPHPVTPSYLGLDLRLAWMPRENFEFAIIGRDLLDPHHPEFRGAVVTREVERRVFGTIKWTF